MVHYTRNCRTCVVLLRFLVFRILDTDEARNPSDPSNIIGVSLRLGELQSSQEESIMFPRNVGCHVPGVGTSHISNTLQMFVTTQRLVNNISVATREGKWKLRFLFGPPWIHTRSTR
jgi:hypothetical protein